MNRKRRNKTGFFLGILLLFLGSVSVTATEQESEPNQLFATAACLMDGDTGRVLFGKRETDPMAMASTTKIMTCILALENGQEQTVATASAKAAAAPKVHLGVREGEQFLLGDLLYSLMLESHNDAAVMIAETIFFVDETYIFLRPFRGHCFYYSFLRAILQEKNEKLCNPL